MLVSEETSPEICRLIEFTLNWFTFGVTMTTRTLDVDWFETEQLRRGQLTFLVGLV